MKWAWLLSAGLLSCLVSGGCARVKPYEREVLSLRCMTPGVEKSEDRFRQHWQFSREGAEGGFGAAGGGCGCN
jgi:hypothetical protein